MAAFSYQNQNQHPPSLLDLSVFLPNSPIKMSGLLEEGCINNTSSCYPYSSPSEHSHSSIPSEKQKTHSFSVVDLQGSSDQVTQMVTPLDMKRKHKDGSCLSSSESKDSKRAKTKKQRDCSGNSKQKEKKKIVPSGYVHVRARRGEATDSHSLAERVRRERISERLKLLQSLVPGCDKVTSKALMLDEIINYVQSLQYQVEFLSMRLASTNPILYDLDAVDVSSVVKLEKPSDLETPTQLPPIDQQVLVTPSSTAVAHATTSFNTMNNYSFPCLLQPEGQRQDDGSLVLWSVDEQRQRFFNHSDFTTLCSFQ